MSSRNARSRRPARTTPDAARRPAFRLEQLEAREVPATFTWTGLGGDNRWSTGANWDAGTAPTGDDPQNPVGIVDDLVFPQASPQKTAQNDLSPDRAFNSITIGGANYQLTGNRITLGLPGVVGSGAVSVNSGTRNVIALGLALGSSAGSDQTFSVFTGADLTVAGRVSGTSGSTLTKDGVGTLTLQNDNSGFTGPVKINDNGGVLVITSPNALGDTSSPTTVGANATLAVRNVAGPIAEPVRLGGLGVSNAGALQNLAGLNTWTGSVELTADAGLGAAADTLVVRGIVSDGGSGFSLFKEGAGEVQLSPDPAGPGNTYRGLTTVNNGVLTVAHPRALGAAGSPANGTLVNQTFTSAGQLRLADPTGFGFIVFDEALTLNGEGPLGLANRGALTNTFANNTWAAPVVLGSPAPNGSDVTVGAAAGTELTIAGEVSAPNAGPVTAIVLTKTDAGRVVLAAGNTFAGSTVVEGGTLTARDSNAFGSAAPGTVVSDAQVVRVTGPAGTFRLTFLGQSTPPLPFDANNDQLTASAAQVEAALNALPTIIGLGTPGGRVAVVRTDLGTNGGPGFQYGITFLGDLGGLDQPKIIAQGVLDPSPSTAPAPFTRVDSVRDGTVLGEIQRVLVLGIGGTYRVAFNGAVTPALSPENPPIVPPARQLLPGQTAAGQLEAALNALPTIGGIGGLASVAELPAPGSLVGRRVFVVTFGGTLAGTDVSQLTVPAGSRVPPATGGGGLYETRVSTERVGVAAGPTVQTVRVTGPAGSFTLTYRGQTTARLPAGATAQQVQDALNALPVLAALGGPVTVLRSTDQPDERTFVILFGGALSGVTVPNVTAQGIPDLAVDIETLIDGGLFPEIQEVTALGGSFTLTFGGQTTPALAANATAGDVQVALNALTSIGPGGVTVTREPLGGGSIYTVAFVGPALVGINQPQMTAVNATVVTIQNGFKAKEVQTVRVVGDEGTWALSFAGVNNTGAPEIQEVSVTGGAGTFTLDFRGQVTPPLPFDATAAQVEAALNALTTIGPGGVTVVRDDLAGGGRFTISFVGPGLIGINQPQLVGVVAGGALISIITIQDGLSSPEVTVALPAGATALQVQNALNALPTVFQGGGSVTVTADPIPDGVLYTVTFGGTFDGVNVPPLVDASTPLTAVARVQDGPQTGAEVQAIELNWSASRGSFRVRYRLPVDPTSVGPQLQAWTPFFPDTISAADLEVALNALPTIGGAGGVVTVTEEPVYLNPPVGAVPYPATVTGKRFRIVFGGTLTGVNVPDVDPATDIEAVPVFPPFQAVPYTIQDGGRSRSVVLEGATVETGVEAADPALPRFIGSLDTYLDSTTGNQDTLLVPESVTLYGRGVGYVGAFYNRSGITDLLGSVTLGGPRNTYAAIGSAADARPGHPTPDASYLTSDYGLTVSGTISGDPTVRLKKRGTGNLVLPFGNDYLGDTFVEEGWVTIRDDRSLGARNTSLGDTVQPRTNVNTGAAVHLLPFNPDVPLTVAENITLAGVGPAHPYEFINRRGALVNLGGSNTWAGDIALKGQAGIGVEQVAAVTAEPLSVSDLTVTGSTAPTPNTVTFSRTGREDQEQSFLIETGVNQGTVTIAYDFGPAPYPFDFQNRLTAYYPPRNPGPGTRLADTGYAFGPGTLTLPYGPGTADQTQVEVVIDEGVRYALENLTAFPFLFPDSWTFTVTLPAVLDGINKYGSGRLRLQGDGTYTGPTNILQGSVLLQNDTGLGRSTSGAFASDQVFTTTTTTVAAGAVLELDRGVAELNGGVSAGIEVWSERLVLGAPGQQVSVAGFNPADIDQETFTLSYTSIAGVTQTTGVLTLTADLDRLAVDIAAALNVLSGIVTDVGSVTVTRTGSVFAVAFGTARSAGVGRLVATAAGGAEVRVSGGNAPLANLAGDNAWRGPVALAAGTRLATAADSRLNVLAAIGDAANPAAGGSDLVKRGTGELLLGGANTYRGTTAVDEGVVTAANGAAFGSADGGTVVVPGAQIQIEGNLTISGEVLTVSGDGTADPPAIPERWFNVGPAPTNNGLSALARPTSGRITGVVVDPTDPNVLYVSSAGGGAWKTKDNGKTWLPLFDRYEHPEGVADGANLVGGSIAVAPSNPQVVYFATGESNAAFDSYAGTGVYKSTDAGRTWVLLINTSDAANPLHGQVVSKLLVDPGDPNRVFVATGTRAAGGRVVNGDLGIRYEITFATTPRPGVDLGKLVARGSDGATTSVRTLDDGVLGRTRDGTQPPIPATPERQLLVVYGSAGTFTLTLADKTTGPLPFDISGVPEVAATTVRNGGGGQNEQQRFTVTEKDFQFSVAFGANTGLAANITGLLSYATTAAELDAALTLLPAIGGSPAAVSVTRTEANGVATFDVTFGGPLANTNVNPMVVRTGLTAVLTQLLTDATGVQGTATVTTPAPVGTPPAVPLTGTPEPGVWRFQGKPGAGGEWRNLTSDDSRSRNRSQAGGTPGTSPYDQFSPGGGGYGPPNTVGPDDDYRVTFPKENATWSDLLIVNGVLLAALGESEERPFIGPAPAGTKPVQQAVRNGVYRTADLGSNRPAWTMATGGIDTRAGGFPTGSITGLGRNGWIKLGGSAPSGIYAVTINPATNNLLDIQRSQDGGFTWAATVTGPVAPGFDPAQPFGNPAQGRYDVAVAVQSIGVYAGFVYQDLFFLGGQNNLYVSLDRGATFDRVNPDALGAGPGKEFHALTFDAFGRVLSGSDGGVWRFDAPAALPAFSDLNGTLGVTQLNSADPHPSDLGRAVAGSQDNGTQQFANSPAWSRVDNDFGSNTGVVRYNPRTPNVIYAVRDGRLRRTTDGGANWSNPNTDATRPLPAATFNFPLVVDPVTPTRILAGGAGLYESVNGGVGFVNLDPPLLRVTAIAAAQFQGAFVPDPGFPLVADRLSNTYVPETLYATDGVTLYVTKDRGQSWVDRTPPALGVGTIQDVVVDPSNRDVVYVAYLRTPDTAGGRVYRTTDAGRSWQAISGAALPSVPTWRLAVDPRTDILYAGTDGGAFQLRDARTADPAAPAWETVGDGLPRVSVRDIVVNQSLNTLTIATYGRGVFQLLLADGQPNAGAVRAVSGSAIWAGDIILDGPTSIGASGTQQVQNGIATASLAVTGVVRDAAGATAPTLTKIGRGTLTLSGTNTYAGQTLVSEGVLQVNNPKALGSADANTVVTAGAALEVRSDLEAEPVTINGRGFLFNGRYSGALRNISNSNTYTGTLTLGTGTVLPGETRAGVTVGADSGSALRIGRDPLGVLAGTGTVADGATAPDLDKELSGTLVLASANDYTGVTRVLAGAVQVQDALALGSAANGTVVVDGARVEVARNAVTRASTRVDDEPLSLSGTGTNRSGALLGARGDANPQGTHDNTWAGPVTLAYTPNTAPPTVPGPDVAVGTLNPADNLTIDAVISPFAPAASLGLVKVGAGRVTLARVNTYSGVTLVEGGALRIRDAGALGQAAESAEVQTVTVAGTAGNYRLQFAGQTTAVIAFDADAATVQARLEALSAIGAGGVFVVRAPTAIGAVYTVFFAGTLADENVPQLVPVTPVDPVGPITAVTAATPRPFGTGTRVSAGAALEIDGPVAPLTVAEVLTINGDGVGGNGALRNVVGDNTYAGPVTLGSDASLGADNGSTLTFDGAAGVAVVRDPSPAAVPASRLRKAGPGTVVFETPGGNPYAGRTVIDNGVLRVGDPLALGSTLPEQQTVLVNGPAGTFTLTFNGASTAPLAGNATASQVQAALNALATVGGVGGGVLVASAPQGGGGTLYTIDFLGTLAAGNLPQLTASSTGGTFALPATTREGPEGTTVNAGGTLQVAGGVEVTTEALSLRGAGYNGQGALVAVGGNATWNAPLLTLAANASLGTVAAADTLTVRVPVIESASKLGVDIVGPGTVEYAAAVDNRYTGTTNVKQGVLLLNSAGVAVLGPLTVGAAAGQTAVVREAADNQVGNAVAVTATANGTFDLNGRTDAVGLVTVQDGAVQTGPGGQLTVTGLAMTGGRVTAGGSGGRVRLGGNVTATSSAAGPAVIDGAGNLDLNGADRTITVADGPAAVDAQVSALPSVSGTFRLTKAGAGRLALSPATAPTLTVAVTAGDLQVDTFAGPVELTAAAASLSGTGRTGSLRGSGGAAAVGTVNPGVNHAADPTGTLRAGTTRFGRDTTFFVDLVDADSFDTLDVNGPATLGTPGNAARLAGKVALDFPFGVPVTILTATGGVAGRFAEPNGVGVAFIDGQKFAVTYSANSVAITKTRASVASFTVATAGSPTTLNQAVRFTATVTPEAGAAVPPGDTVTFTVTGPNGFTLTAARPIVANVAVLDLPDAGAGLAALPGGTFTVTAAYDNNADTFEPIAPVQTTQVVEVPAVGDLTGGPAVISPNNPTSVGVRDEFTGTATVTGERAETTVVVTVTPAAGGEPVRTFTTTVDVDPANTFPADVLWDGRDQDGNATLPEFVPDGAYVVTATFTDEFGNTGTTNGVTVVVDNTTPEVVSAVIPTTQLVPGGTAVRVLDGVVADANLAGWTVTIRSQAAGAVARTFTGTGTTVAVDWDGTGEGGVAIADGRYVFDLTVTDGGGNTVAVDVPGTVLVLGSPPTIDPPVVTPAGPSFISPLTSVGVQDGFRVQTTVRNEAAPTATSTVTVRDVGGAVVRTYGPTAAVIGNKSFVVDVTWDGLTDAGPPAADGVYTVTVSFADEFGATGETAPVSVTVDNTLPAVLSPVTSSARLISPGLPGLPGSTDLAGAVTDANLDRWEVRVSGAAGVVRTIAGTGPNVAAVFDGRDDAGNIVPDGTYTFAVRVFDRAGNSTEAPGAQVVVLTVAPAVTLTAPTTTVYGQTITLTAAVQVQPGVADLLAGGTVQFFDGAALLGTQTLGAADGTGTARATITVPTFNAGTYAALTAVYGGSPNFLGGNSPAAAPLVVTPAQLAVRADDKAKVYGAAVPGLTYQVAGLVNGDSAAVVTGSPVTAATAASPVGVYRITQGSLVANGNYTITFGAGTLTVTPAPLRVVANDASKVVGSPNPALTARYEGLVNGDTAAVVSGLALATTATTDSRVGNYPIFFSSPTAPNYAITTAAGTLSVVPVPTDIVVGGGAGGGVAVYDSSGRPKATYTPFPGFAGGVRTASADFNRDGVADIVAITGPGTVVQVVVLDGANGNELFRDLPFEDFTGGGFVAVGDVTGDGQADLVVTPDEGGGPRVIMYRGGDFAPLLSYFGIDDPDFRGGARASVGDINADGFAEIVVSAGFGGGPRVSIWSGRALASGDFATLTSDFLLFDPSLRNGTYTAVGDVTGDGFGDLIAGAGPGGGPRVLILDGRRLERNGPASALSQPVANFFAGNTANRGGVRVAAKNLDGDLFADVVTGPGTGGGSTAVAYRGKALADGLGADELFDLPGFGDLSGVFVG